MRTKALSLLCFHCLSIFKRRCLSVRFRCHSIYTREARESAKTHRAVLTAIRRTHEKVFIRVPMVRMPPPAAAAGASPCQPAEFGLALEADTPRAIAVRGPGLQLGTFALRMSSNSFPVCVLDHKGRRD
eukprot:SAG22_NODE_3115_length_1928_cov_1.236741_3_plen_129_part_00